MRAKKKKLIYNSVTFGLAVTAFIVCQILLNKGCMSRSFKGQLIPICCWITMAVSLNLVVGISGELSLGHAGFMSVGAFSGIINSLVADIFTPIIGMLLGSQTDFSGLKIGQIMIGNFINAVISFLITALCRFSVVKAINTAKQKLAKPKEEEPEAEPEPSEEVKLLSEIAAELKKLNEKK